MITIYYDDNDGQIKICGEHEKVEYYDVKTFFNNGTFVKIIKDTTVFVNDFQDFAMLFINGLLDAGFRDDTMYELSYSKNHKLDVRAFKYILRKDSHSFFSISYNVGGTVVNLCEYKNLVSADLKHIIKDFGGEPVVAMYRSCIQVRSYAPRSKTLSGCAYSYWKGKFPKHVFERNFQQCSEKAEKICRDAYHGGLCLIKKGCENKTFKHGCILDANSLYPYIMKTRKFAIGMENYGVGDVPKKIKNADDCTYFVRFKCRFELKPNHIPFVRTRCDERHWQLEILETSDYYDREGNRYDFCEAPGSEYVDEYGEIHEGIEPIKVELCMYKPEFELFFEQYNVYDVEYIEHVWYKTSSDIFTEYVDEFYEQKKNAKNPSERRISKMMLNALSGRLSLILERENSYFREDIKNLLDNYGTLDYSNKKLSSKGKYTKHFAGESISTLIEDNMTTHSQSQSHIQIGAAITSEAMCFIIRAAQANYDHFLYTDTDSLHLDCWPNEAVGVEIGDEIGQFKIEHKCIKMKYFQPKVYSFLECDVLPGTKVLAGKDYHVTWAGMPENCQKLLEIYLYDVYIKDFIHHHFYDINDINNMLMNVEDMTARSLKKYRPKGISDSDWDFFLDSLFWKRATGETGNRHELFKVAVPYTRRTIKSYKNCEFCTKTEWYRVDIMTK